MLQVPAQGGYPFLQENVRTKMVLEGVLESSNRMSHWNEAISRFRSG